MILNCHSIFAQWKLPMSKKACLASATSGVSTDQLREQLDLLHKEAETTAAKANSARLRLVRLSEAADRLHLQAVHSIQSGKENDARELLYQKRKIMQAMEKAKNRIELLDELSSKLRQVLSAKESQLIGNVNLDLEIDRDDSAATIRIVPPKEECSNNSTENGDNQINSPSHYLEENLEAGPQSLDDDFGMNSCEGLLKGNDRSEADTSSTLESKASYPELLENIDSQLSNIEDELTTFVRYSALILGSKDKVENSKVQLVVEILENVCQIRARIATMMQTEVSTR